MFFLNFQFLCIRLRNLWSKKSSGKKDRFTATKLVEGVSEQKKDFRKSEPRWRSKKSCRNFLRQFHASTSSELLLSRIPLNMQISAQMKLIWKSESEMISQTFQFYCLLLLRLNINLDTKKNQSWKFACCTKNEMNSKERLVFLLFLLQFNLESE